MKRLFSLAILGIALALAGCGSDPRESVISNTIENMRNAATQVGNTKDKINDMVKKTEKGRPDLQPVLEAVKSLKEVAKDLQKRNLEAEKLPKELSEEERTKLKSKYQLKLNEAITQLNEERKALMQALDAAEAKFKEDTKELRRRIEETDGEFEVIARSR